MAKRKKQKRIQKLKKSLSRDKQRKEKQAEKQTELEKIEKEIKGTKKLLKKLGRILKKLWSTWKKIKGRGYWTRGIIWGWAFFIAGFFISVLISDALVFSLLFPGWFISSLVNGKGFTIETHFGPLLILVIFFSFLFYCLAGALIGLGIEHLKYRKERIQKKPKKEEKKKPRKPRKTKKKSRSAKKNQ